MSLKQHNDIVEKLIAQIDSKDAEISKLKKQLHKTGALFNDQAKSKAVDTQKETSKKIALLHKEYKDKINALSQQIRNRSLENKQLKSTISTLKNIQAKQKQHIAEVLKNTAHISSYDSKFASLASHYQSQLQKKDKHINNLQKQIKQNFYLLSQIKTENPTLTKNMSNPERNTRITYTDGVNSCGQNEELSKCQNEITMLRKELAKQKKLGEEMQKQFKDLSKRYSQLTKEYYRIFNEHSENEGSISSNKLQKKPILKKMLNIQDSWDMDQSSRNEYLATGSVQTFGKIYKQSSDQIEVEDMRNVIDQLMEILKPQSRVQIVPAVLKIKQKCERFADHELISKRLQSTLRNLGMGEVRTTDLMNEIDRLQATIAKLESSSDLLDEICIEIGAKKQKIIEKIRDLKATEQQLFKNLKDISFMQKLPKANKIRQFIEYFQLDEEVCELPDQLRKMCEQIKYVDKFIKQASLILSKEPANLEKSLDFIIRYLERKQAEEALKSQKEKRVKNNQ